MNSADPLDRRIYAKVRCKVVSLPKVSLVVPCFNQWKHTLRFLESVDQLDLTGVSLELVLVDNASGDETSWQLGQWLQKAHPYTMQVVTNAVNWGFPTAINQGMATATGEYLFISNNDVVLPEFIVQDLVTLVQAHPSAVFGPVSNSVSGVQMHTATLASMEDYRRVAATLRQQPQQLLATPRLAGLFLAMHRSTWDQVGVMDPYFTPGNFEDDDWCLRAQVAQVPLFVVNNLLLYHEGSASFGQLHYSAILERNWMLFSAKWTGRVDLPYGTQISVTSGELAPVASAALPSLAAFHFREVNSFDGAQIYMIADIYNVDSHWLAKLWALYAQFGVRTVRLYFLGAFDQQQMLEECRRLLAALHWEAVFTLQPWGESPSPRDVVVHTQDFGDRAAVAMGLVPLDTPWLQVDDEFWIRQAILDCDTSLDPVIDVIITTRNRLPELKETIGWALSFRGSYKLHIIVKVNGSTDGTQDWVLGLNSPSVELDPNTQNLGSPAGFNQAFKQTQSPWLIKLDDDVVLPRDYLAGLLSGKDVSPYVAVVGMRALRPILPIEVHAGRMRTYPTISHDFRLRQPPIPDPSNYASMVAGTIMLFRRDLLAVTGGLDTTFSPTQFDDSDICLKAWRLGFEVYYLGSLSLVHRGQLNQSPWQAANRGQFFSRWSRDKRLFIDTMADNSQTFKRLLALEQIPSQPVVIFGARDREKLIAVLQQIKSSPYGAQPIIIVPRPPALNFPGVAGLTELDGLYWTGDDVLPGELALLFQRAQVVYIVPPGDPAALALVREYAANIEYL